MTNTLSIGRGDKYLLIKADGEMRAGNTFALNDYLSRYVEKNGKGLRLLFDLSGCTYMDSTFIGFIISLERKCEKNLAEAVEIINPSPESRASLKKLFVLDKLKVAEEVIYPETVMFDLVADNSSFSDKKNMKIVFDSHKELSGLSEENRKEFECLLEGLQAELNL